MLKDLITDVRRFLPGHPGLSRSEALRALVRGILSPGFQAIVVYRTFRWAKRRGIPTQPLRFVAERIIESTTGISIPADADIGPGLRIHHFGCIVLHPAVRMGSNCTLYHEVTLGADGLTEKAPEVGNDVLIGAGAKVLGGITIGNRSKIGANAVVLHSFPDDSVLVGAPAKNARKDRSSC